MKNPVNSVLRMLDFQWFNSEPTPEEQINRIEETLTQALSRRQSARQELKQERRKARLERSRAEDRLDDDDLTGEDLTELRHHIRGQEEIIQEHQSRIETLTTQITAIRKRFPKLRILRTDIELMKELRADTSWQEDVDQLMQTLQTEDPVNGSANSELNSLLDTVDHISDTAQTPTSASPSFTAEFDETEDNHDHDHEHETTHPSR